MKNINLNDLNDTNVDPIEAADVKGGPAYIKLGDIKGESRRAVPTEQISLGYTEVEWTY